jgi:hypothetical protein
MLEADQLARVEEKLDRLLAALERFGPLLDKLMSSKLAVRAMTFSKGTPHGSSPSPRS